MSKSDKYDHNFSIQLVGKSSGGKDALLRAYSPLRDNTCNEIAFEEFFIKGKKIRLTLFDFSGLDLRRMLLGKMGENIDAIIFMFSMIEEQSLKEIIEFDKSIEGKKFQKILIGNKCDFLHSEEKEIILEKVKDFVKSSGMQFYEANLEEKKNIQEILMKLAKDLLKIACKKSKKCSEPIKSIQKENNKCYK